jgi:hypothetical protein
MPLYGIAQDEVRIPPALTSRKGTTLLTTVPEMASEFDDVLDEGVLAALTDIFSSPRDTNLLLRMMDYNDT